MTGLMRAACIVLSRRADQLRVEADRLGTTVHDGRGRAVHIEAPEGVVKRRTADFLDECAADLRQACHGAECRF